MRCLRSSMRNLSIEGVASASSRPKKLAAVVGPILKPVGSESGVSECAEGHGGLFHGCGVGGLGWDMGWDMGCDMGCDMGWDTGCGDGLRQSQGGGARPDTPRGAGRRAPHLAAIGRSLQCRSQAMREPTGRPPRHTEWARQCPPKGPLRPGCKARPRIPFGLFLPARAGASGPSPGCQALFAPCEAFLNFR